MQLQTSPAVVCSHFGVSIHLHLLIITQQVFPFFTLLSPPLPPQLLRGRSFRNSTCVASQNLRPESKVWQETPCRTDLGFLQDWGNKEEHVCVCVCDTLTSGEWEPCRHTLMERETRFIITKRISCRCQLTGSASAANYRHSRNNRLHHAVCLLVPTWMCMFVRICTPKPKPCLYYLRLQHGIMKMPVVNMSRVMSTVILLGKISALQLFSCCIMLLCGKHQGLFQVVIVIT